MGVIRDWQNDATKVRVTIKFPGQKAVVYTGFHKMSLSQSREVRQGTGLNARDLVITGKQIFELRMWSGMENFEDFPVEERRKACRA